MSDPTAALLSDANRQVQIADHLLTVTYDMVKDPKLLLSIIEHLRKAIEDAAEAVVEHHVAKNEYDLPDHVKVGTKHDAIAALRDLLQVRKPDIPSDDAINLFHDFQQTLQQHKDAHTTFKRDEKLVIAGEGFAYLKEVSPSELKRGLHTTKQFVHSVNQYIIAR